jgi:predicted DNA-binding transcriptional regulator YafY
MVRKKLPKTAVPRIYFIDREIASGKYPNAPSMAKKYETSLSSINRDIAYMRDMLGAPIEYDFFKKGFYYTKPTFRLAAGYASADDLLALGMAKSLLDLYRDTPIHAAALNLLESISAPLKDEKSAEWFKDRIIIPRTASVPVNSEVWNAVVRALKENRKILFQYRPGHYSLGGMLQIKNGGKRKKPETRRVRPYQLLFDKTAWYLFGYDENRAGMRIFALSRIDGIIVLDEFFTIPQNFDYRILNGNSYFGVYSGLKSQKFVIEIFGNAGWVRERTWGDNQTIKETANGIMLSFVSTQTDKILEWILSQGPNTRPLAPKEFVEQWKENVRAMEKLAQ